MKRHLLASLIATRAARRAAQSRTREEDRMFLLGFPLLLIPFAIYNIIALLMPGVKFSDRLFAVPMLSKVDLVISTGDLLVIFAILLLFVEIIKATRLGSRAILDHVLSLILFLGMLAEFMIVQLAATSTFLLLCTLSFVDVIGGFSVTIRTSQRDVALEGIERV
jgi:hypothetical protein